MPATNSLQPPLTPAERAVVRSYGDWTSFMQSMGLKPYELSDIEEAEQIVRQLAAQSG